MKPSTWITFAALCILSASAWVADQTELSTLPSLEKQGLLYAAIALIALVISGPRIRSRNNWRSSLSLALASILFFGLPALAIELASGSVPQITRSALFALVPIAVIITLTAGNTPESGGRHQLIPALTGIAGLLLLLPLDFSTTPRGVVMLAILSTAVIVVGVAGVWLFRNLPNFSFTDGAAFACLSTATFLLICNSFLGSSIWKPRDLLTLASIPSLIFLIEVILLLWLLRAMPPIQFAARYLLIPLITVVEGYVLLRPALTLRTGFGAILLAIGTAALLFLKPSGEDEMPSLR
jgi:drug/metabolite transporter (DMT)-like permease